MMFLGTMVDDLKNLFYTSSSIGSFEDAITFDLGTIKLPELID
jgi:hypothetical protein